ncbi:MAG: hypothetical protein JO341_06575 [Gammaproteobacteria bacterium]|nr:hypothetical protein [Gammaproteobacteria bacterium]MBV9620674.1 hypothetical protein [Gammaproteobacteria bacterium]
MPRCPDPAHRYLLVTLALLAIGGCSRHTPSTAKLNAPPTAPPFAQSDTGDTYDPQDPCNLLDPKEVEAVLGAPLAVPPYRAGSSTFNPSPSGENCVYESGNFRYITLEVDREGGAQHYSMTGMVKNLMKMGGGSAPIQNNVKKNFQLDDGTELAGEWDEASLMPMNCCIFMALRGDQLVTIDFTGSTATLKQAAQLVDSAYKRMDSPLKIDGGAAVAAAKTFDKTRPQPVDVCSLLTRAEVEAIIGRLARDPISHGHDGCEYAVAVPQQNVPEQYELQVRWRNGYYQWRSDQHTGHLGGAAVGQMAKDVAAEMGAPLPEQAPPPDPSATPAAGSAGTDPAETPTFTALHLAAVKRDVEVAVAGSYPNTAEGKAKARGLVTAALAKV